MFVLMFISNQRRLVLIPTAFQNLGLTNVDYVGLHIDDFIDPRFVRMFLINEFHVLIIYSEVAFCSATINYCVKSPCEILVL